MLAPARDAALLPRAPLRPRAITSRRREENLERRARARRARHGHVAARATDDPVHGEETEPRAAVRGLRREVRLEDARAHIGVHADTGIRDADADERAGREPGLPRALRIELDVRRLDRDAT